MNRYYVPVTSFNEEAENGGTGHHGESNATYIYLDFYQKKLPLGEVSTST